MDEAKLRTVAQLQEFLDATQEVTFTGAPGEGDQQRYEHISRVLKRLGYTALGNTQIFQSNQNLRVRQTIWQ